LAFLGDFEVVFRDLILFSIRPIIGLASKLANIEELNREHGNVVLGE
jgi:hypothetical protein